MEIKLNELAELVEALNEACTPKKREAIKRDLGTQIVVADRGFVYVGKVVVEGDYCLITNARNIRKWGTSNGLGELVGGPTKETVLDQVGEVIVPMKAVIHFIKCSRDW